MDDATPPKRKAGPGRNRRDGSGGQRRIDPQLQAAEAMLELRRRIQAKAEAVLSTPVSLAKAVGIIPDPWQETFLLSTASRVLLNCCRQSGKSTTTAFLALHEALTKPKSPILLLSPGERQSSELMLKVREAYNALGQPVPATKHGELSLWLENGSRIMALPGKPGTIRGYSGVKLLVVDECAWVPDELYHAVRPMLAVSQGRLICLSTPHGKRGWWSDAWHDTKQEWLRIEVPAEQCPRISAEFLEEEKLAMGEWLYDQEYHCQFKASATSLFTPEDIEAAHSADMEVWSDWLLAPSVEREQIAMPVAPSPQETFPTDWMDVVPEAATTKVEVYRP